ncbi:YfiT family bacillithiol transferase [Pradoshia sp.]
MDLRYPVGTFQFEGEMNSEVISEWIKEMEELPGLLRETVKDLDEHQLNTAYRPDGWTVRQVIHHLADSHMNAYIRLKLALTEDSPVIKTYDETKWAELIDYQLPVESSLMLLAGLHARWTELLRHLSSSDLKKTFTHPDLGEVLIDKNIGMYAWHGRHHLAHITSLCERKGW